MMEITENIKTWVNAEVGRLSQISNYTGISPLDFLELIKTEIRKEQKEPEAEIEKEVKEPIKPLSSHKEENKD